MEATTAETASKIIDKIADKLGVAADQLKPLAEKVVQEYQLQQFVIFWACIVAAAVALIIGFIIAYKLKRAYNGDREMIGIQFVPIVISSIVSIIVALSSIHFIANAYAPTYECLKMLMGK